MTTRTTTRCGTTSPVGTTWAIRTLAGKTGRTGTTGRTTPAIGAIGTRSVAPLASGAGGSASTGVTRSARPAGDPAHAVLQPRLLLLLPARPPEHRADEPGRSTPLRAASSRAAWSRRGFTLLWHAGEPLGVPRRSTEMPSPSPPPTTAGISPPPFLPDQRHPPRRGVVRLHPPARRPHRRQRGRAGVPARPAAGHPQGTRHARRVMQGDGAAAPPRHPLPRHHRADRGVAGLPGRAVRVLRRARHRARRLQRRGDRGAAQSVVPERSGRRAALPAIPLALLRPRRAAGSPVRVREFDSMLGAILHGGGHRRARRRRRRSPSSPSTTGATSPRSHPSCSASPARTMATFSSATSPPTPLEAAARGPRVRRHPSRHRRGHRALPRECPYFLFCGGGAPANKYFENGSFDSTETLFCSGPQLPGPSRCAPGIKQDQPEPRTGTYCFLQEHIETGLAVEPAEERFGRGERAVLEVLVDRGPAATEGEVRALAAACSTPAAMSRSMAANRGECAPRPANRSPRSRGRNRRSAGWGGRAARVRRC